MIPQSSIIAMAISLIILLGLLIGIFLVLKRKFGIKVVPLAVGVAFFVIFALVLEQMLHGIVLQPNAQGQILLMNSHPVVYIIYGVLAAGIFEETARLLAFKLLKNSYPDFGTSIVYGLGHGGIELLILGGVPLLSNLIISLLLSNPNGRLAQELPQSVIQALQGAHSGEFFLVVIERFPALLIQICLSVLVWIAVNKANRFWLFPMSILFHAIVDIPSVMAQVGFLSNYVILYGLLYLMTIGLIVLTIQLIKRNELYP